MAGSIAAGGPGSSASSGDAPRSNDRPRSTRARVGALGSFTCLPQGALLDELIRAPHEDQLARLLQGPDDPHDGTLRLFHGLEPNGPEQGDLIAELGTGTLRHVPGDGPE